MLYSIQRNGYKMGCRRVPVDLPGQVMPGESRGRWAGNACITPDVVRGIPNIPNATTFDIALRPKDEFARAIGLVNIEFQGLGILRRTEVKIHVILKVRRRIIGAKLSPPKGVRVRMASAQEELHRLAILRGRAYKLLAPECCRGASPSRTGAGSAALPSAHLFDQGESGSRTGWTGGACATHIDSEIVHVNVALGVP